jgi:phage/plasmid primase-like uncharacterized protein
MIKEMLDYGLSVDSLIANGEIQRVDGQSKQSGWYLAREVNGKIFGIYGDWVTGDSRKYRNGNGRAGMTEAEALAMRLLITEQRRKKEEMQVLASIMAEYEYEHAEELPDDHPYVSAKGITNYGGKLGKKGEILVPLIDKEGVVSSLQRIYPDGSKKLYYGGRKKGCCHVIPGINADYIYMCEGWATGCTIREATGCKVLVAVDAYNLLPVARAARTIFPTAHIVIAADNDHTKPKNTGLQEGTKAAEDINASIVSPLDIEGTDFNDMAAEHGLPFVGKYLRDKLSGRVEVMTYADLMGVNMTTDLHGLDAAGGLFESGMAGLMGDGMPTIKQYAFPVVCTAIARAISGKITCQNVWPNLYCVKVGPTSSGKTDSDRALAGGLRGAGLNDFVGITDIASGPGLYRALINNPVTLFVMDEATGIFRHYGGNDPVADGKREALMDIFTKSGESIRKNYGAAKNDIVVDSPCLTFVGNTTPLIFNAITLDDFRSGLIPRFDFYCYDGKVQQRGVKTGDNQDLFRFVEGLRMLMETRAAGNLSTITGRPVDLDLTPGAADLLSEHSRLITDAINTEGNDSVQVGIISRKYYGSIKYALTHLAATRRAEDLYNPMDEQSIQWGIDVVNRLEQWKMGVLESRIVTGEFHRDCEVFKAAIKIATLKSDRRPTFKWLANWKKELKNWKRKQSEEVILVLQKRGEIVVDETGKKTAYFLAKK